MEACQVYYLLSGFFHTLWDSPSQELHFPGSLIARWGHVTSLGQWNVRKSGYVLHWKRPWCWEGLRAEGEGDDRGWDGWMASPTRWTWVWVNSRKWWWTGRPGVLRFMGSQRVGRDWATELNWTELIPIRHRWVVPSPYCPQSFCETLEGRYWDWQCWSSKEPEFLRYLSDQARNQPEISTFDFMSPRNKLLL